MMKCHGGPNEVVFFVRCFFCVACNFCILHTVHCGSQSTQGVTAILAKTTSILTSSKYLKKEQTLESPTGPRLLLDSTALHTLLDAGLHLLLN